MTSNNFKAAPPTPSISIGGIISDALEAKSMKQSELCDLTGIARPVLNDVVKGRRGVTAEMAVLIESALSLSADWLLAVQNKIELEKAYNNSKIANQLKCMSDWEQMKNYISMPVMKKMGFFESGVAGKVGDSMKICRVSDINEFERLVKQEDSQAYYKKSEKLNIDKAALFTWKNYCMFESLHSPIEKPFNKQHIDALKTEVIDILSENRDTYRRVKEAFERFGVRLLYIEKVGHIPVDGLSFWIDENPTVVITRRMPNIDNFAFSTMHELGHIQLHLSRNSQALVNLDGEDIDEIEAEANKYARDSFVSQEEWDKFMRHIANCNPYAVHVPIKKEAEKLRVNPQILYGRYMNDTGLYRLRRVFPTEVC